MKPFEKWASVMLRPWFIVSYLIFILVSFLYIDQPLALFIQSLSLKTHWPLLRWVTNVGLGGTYILSLPIIALILRYGYQKKTWENRAWFLWACVLIPSIICLGIKFFFGRSRPDLLFQDNLYGFYWLQTKAQFWSFPSGHTSTIMGLVFGLSILFPRYAYGVVICGMCVALSRVLLTHHYLSDVLFAGYLSFIEIAILYYWVKYKSACKNFQKIVVS